MYCWQLIYIFLYVLNCKSTFMDRCPESEQWRFRAKSYCNNNSNYVCLFDRLNKGYRELCRDNTSFRRPGFVSVISGNIDTFDDEPCKDSRYQPYKWLSNGTSKCELLKTTCSGEGQVIYSNGTNVEDRTCRCDYTQWYNFVTMPKNKCFCIPSEEDCTCYINFCPFDTLLTPDYECATKWTGRYSCPEITKHKKLDHSSPTEASVCPKCQTLSPERSKVKVPNIATVTGLLLVFLLGLSVIVRCIQYRITDKFKVVGEIKSQQNTDEQLKRTKLCLLKNYTVIVQCILPDDIAKFMKEKDIMSCSDFADIKKCRTLTEKSRMLMKITLNSGTRGYDAFLAALAKDKNEIMVGLSESIKNTKVNKNETVDLYDYLLVEPIPTYIREQHYRMINMWKASDEKKMVYTNTVIRIYGHLNKDNQHIITVTGSFGSGKTIATQLTALMLEANGYDIVPCSDPNEILLYNNDSRHQIFWFDDFCGYCIPDMSLVSSWEKKFAVVQRVLENNTTKIILSSKSNIFISLQRHLPKLLTRNKFDILTDQNRLSEDDKSTLLWQYVSSKMTKDSLEIVRSTRFSFLPLLLQNLCNKEKIERDDLMSEVEDIISQDLENLLRCNYQTTAALLSLFVIFGKQIRIGMLNEIGNKRDLIETMKDFYNMQTKLSPQIVKEHLKCVKDSYIKETDDHYEVLDDYIYYSLVRVFCKTMFDAILATSPPECLRDRYVFEENGVFECLISVPFEKENMYFHRLLRCMQEKKEGMKTVFQNKNLKCELYRSKFCTFIKNNKEKISDLQQCPLVFAADCGHLDIVQTLLSIVDININGRGENEMTALCVAAKNDTNFEITRVLLMHDCNPFLKDRNQNSPLLIASEYGNIKTVKTLVTYYALLDKSDKVNEANDNQVTPLFAASKNGHTQVVDYLLNHKADPFKSDKNEMTPLFIASQNGHTKVVKSLLNKDTSLKNINDNKKRLPLHIASENGHFKVVEELLRCKSYADKIDKTQSVALDLASRYNDDNHKAVVEILLMFATWPNTAIAGKITPLKRACKAGASETVRVLLHYGADPNVFDSVMRSPLHDAAENGFADIVSCLIKAGADVTFRNSANKSPLSLAFDSYEKRDIGRDAYNKIKTAIKIQVNSFINQLEYHSGQKPEVNNITWRHPNYKSFKAEATRSLYP